MILLIKFIFLHNYFILSNNKQIQMTLSNYFALCLLILQLNAYTNPVIPKANVPDPGAILYQG